MPRSLGVQAAAAVVHVVPPRRREACARPRGADPPSAGSRQSSAGTDLILSAMAGAAMALGLTCWLRIPLQAAVLDIGRLAILVDAPEEALPEPLSRPRSMRQEEV
jgi:hypothetical protein